MANSSRKKKIKQGLNKKNKGNDDIQSKDNKKIKEKITEVLELPKEILLNISRLTMMGNKELIIENYKGVVEYGVNCIRVNIGNGLIKISGSNLTIREITSEDIKIEGKIISLEFQD